MSIRTPEQQAAIDSAALAELPSSYDRAAPKFRGSSHSLQNFLDEIQTIMHSKTLTDRQKKIYTVRHVEYPDSESWRSIDEFNNDATSYETFLAKIWALYPGARPSQISPEQLLSIVRVKQSLGGVEGMEDFAAYRRQFIAKSEPLVRSQHLSAREVASLFMSGLSQRLQTLASLQLEISKPAAAAATDPFTYAPRIYSIEDISNAVYQVLQGPNLIAQTLAPGIPSFAPNPPIHGASLIPPFQPAPFAAPLVSSPPPVNPPVVPQAPSVPFGYGQPQANPMFQPPLKQEDRFEQLLSQIQNLTTKVNTLTQAQSSSKGKDRRDLEPCWYCGEPDCAGMRGRRCATFRDDEASGLIACDPQTFKITMKDGRQIPGPRNIPLHQRALQMMPRANPAPPANPVQPQTTGNYFFHEIPTSIPTIPIASVNTVYMPEQTTSRIEEVTEEDEELEALDDQIQALSMMASDSSKRLEEIEASIFELDKKNNFTRRRGLRPGPGHNSQGIAPEKEAAQPAPQPWKPLAPKNPAPPVIPPVAAIPSTFPPNPAKVYQPRAANTGPQMGYVAPVEDKSLPPKLLDRILEQTVQMKLSELLSVSSDMRKGVREKVTSKRVPVEPALIQSLSYEDEQAAIFIKRGDLIRQLLADCPADHLIVADDRADMQALPMWINYTHEEECILDSGAQICSIAEDVWNRLKMVPFDPRYHIHMQSANGVIDRTIGLCANVPLTISNITFYIQFQIVKTDAFAVLLGQPFMKLANLVVHHGRTGERTTVTIEDPNSGSTIQLPCYDRGRRELTQIRPNPPTIAHTCFWQYNPRISPEQLSRNCHHDH